MANDKQLMFTRNIGIMAHIDAGKKMCIRDSIRTGVDRT